MRFLKKALRWLLRLSVGAVGVFVLLWCGASLYFLIAGRDIAQPDLSDYEVSGPELPPEANAYTFIKDYAQNHPTNINWKVANECLLGKTNWNDCVELLKGVLAAESNAFRCVEGVMASRGLSVPPPKYYAFVANVCLCLRVDKLYRVKSMLEAGGGNLAAGRATLMELFRFGKRLVELDEGLSHLIGEALENIAIIEMDKPLFAPDGDEAWLAELQKMTAAMGVGDADRAKRSIRNTLALSGAGYLTDGSAQLASHRIVSALKLNWIPGYSGYAFQANRTLAVLKDKTERFVSKIDAPYDIEYARKFKFGRWTIPSPLEPVNPLSCNWFGQRKVENFGFGGSYCRFFRQRFFVRSQEAILACRRYRARQGRYPDRLEELVPEFLNAVPLDPFDGKPLRYNAEHHYIWTPGPELTFDGTVEFTPEGKPMWISTRSRDHENVRFLSPAGANFFSGIPLR